MPNISEDCHAEPMPYVANVLWRVGNRRRIGPVKDCLRAFSLVELLVVGILVSLLLPAVQSAREAGRRAHCENNLKQMALAVHSFHDVKKVFPDGGGGGADWSWAVLSLPFVEGSNVQALFDLESTYLAPRNQIAMTTLLPLYQCPSAPQNEVVTGYTLIPGDDDIAETNYLSIATHRNVAQAVDLNGSGIMFPLSKVKIRHVTDGLSKTLLIGEADVLPNDPLLQAYPHYCTSGNGDCPFGFGWCLYTMATTYYGINSRPEYMKAGIQSWHPGGAHFAFADGHVAMLTEDIDQTTLTALTTRSGGETIGSY
jgi:prepilin-type processing-associated H-X9-DG protein